MPGWRDRKPVTSATIRSRSVFSLASICTVTSLAMSRSQAEADWFIMYTAPAVSEARKHMMVMTTVSERPVTEPAGTIGALVRLRADLAGAPLAFRRAPWSSRAGGHRAGAAAAERRTTVCGAS